MRRQTLSNAEGRLNQQQPFLSQRKKPHNSRASILPQSAGPAHRAILNSHGKQNVDYLMSNLTVTPAPHPAQSTSTGRRSTISKENNDPRQLRDHAWQQSAVQNLIQYLHESGYQHNLSPKVLNPPVIKDFEMVFKFIYSRIDPAFQWVKKFEDELLAVLKSLKYPFAERDQFTLKSQTHLVSTDRIWPYFLAALIWMIELALSSEQISRMLTDDPPVDYVKSQFYRFQCTAYGQYMQQGDTYFDIMNDDMANWFDDRDQAIMIDLKRTLEDNEMLQAEIDNFEDAPSPLEEANDKQEALKDDIEKLVQYNQKAKARQQKLLQQIHEVTEKENVKLAELGQLEHQVEVSSEIVNNQELSPDDVDRMNDERQTLSHQVSTLNSSINDLEQSIGAKEIQVQGLLDQIDTLVRDFNQAASAMELIPKTAANAKGKNFRLEFSSARSAKFINVEVHEVLPNELRHLEEDFKLRINDVQMKQQSVKEMIDASQLVITDTEDAIAQLIDQMKLQVDQHEQERDQINSTIEQQNQELDQITRDMKRGKLDGNRQLLELQRQVRELTHEYEQQVKKLQQQKDVVQKEFNVSVEEVEKFKGHIAKQLQDLGEMSRQKVSELQDSTMQEDDAMLIDSADVL